MTSGVATLHELQTVYGLEDLCDLLEIAAVDARNREISAEIAKREAEQ